MYQIPLKFIKVGPAIAICATRIVAILTTDSYQARETIKAERRAGTLINAAGTSKALCAIFLDNGSVVSCPYSTDTIMRRIDKATHSTRFNKKETKDVVYPNEDDYNNDYPEIESSYDEEFVLEEDSL